MLVHSLRHALVGGQDLRRRGVGTGAFGCAALRQQLVGGLGEGSDADILVDPRHDDADDAVGRERHETVVALFEIFGRRAAAQFKAQGATVAGTRANGDHALDVVGQRRPELGAVFLEHGDGDIAELPEVAASADAAVTAGATAVAGTAAAVTAGLPVQVAGIGEARAHTHIFGCSYGARGIGLGGFAATAAAATAHGQQRHQDAKAGH